MTTRKTCKSTIHWLPILPALALWCAGCSSVVYEKSDATARSLQNAAEEVQAQSHALETTMTALSDLVNKPATDLRPQFRWFSSSLDRLVAAADRTARTGKLMRTKSAAYFEAWGRELVAMNYEYIRKNSEMRKAEVSARFQEINRQYQEAGDVVRPLIGYLDDVRKALSADLTMGGLAAVKPIVANAQENAGKVQTVLAKLTADLSTSGTQMSSIALQSAPAPMQSTEPK